MKTYKRKLADAVVFTIDGFARTLGTRFYNIFLDQITRHYHRFNDNIQINIADRPAHFVCPNRLTRWRLETFFTKEPATISWIDTFSEGSIMWDIGANIGIYSIYAAITRNTHVLAFEPAPANYSVLSENIMLNHLSDKIAAFPIALTDKCELGKLNMINMDAGSSFSKFSNSPTKGHSTFSLLGYSIDDFIKTFNPLFPTYIKIDVDGIEEKILEGASQTLRDPRLISVCVEGDKSQAEQLATIKKIMMSNDFNLENTFTSPLYPESPYMNLYFLRQ